MTDLYNIIGVDPDASAEEIKKSYKNLARKLHPDKNKERNAEEKFKELSQAYEVLKNKDSRQDYDFQRKYCKKGDEDKRFQTNASYDSSTKTRTFKFSTDGYDNGYNNTYGSDDNFFTYYQQHHREGTKPGHTSQRSHSDSHSASSSPFRGGSSEKNTRSSPHRQRHSSETNYEEPFDIFSRASSTRSGRKNARKPDRCANSWREDYGIWGDAFANPKPTPTYSNGFYSQLPQLFDAFESIIDSDMQYVFRRFLDAGITRRHLCPLNGFSHLSSPFSQKFTNEPSYQKPEMYSCAFCGMRFNLIDMKAHEQKCVKARPQKKYLDSQRKSSRSFTAEPSTDRRNNNLFHQSSLNETELDFCGCNKNHTKIGIHSPSCDDRKYTSWTPTSSNFDGFKFPPKTEWTRTVYTPPPEPDIDFIPESLSFPMLSRRLSNILNRNSRLAAKRPIRSWFADDKKPMKYGLGCDNCQLIYGNNAEYMCSCSLNTGLR